MRHCTSCGGNVSETARFCNHCGAVLRTADSTGRQRGRKRKRGSRRGPDAEVRTSDARGSEHAARQTRRKSGPSEASNVPGAAAFKGLRKPEALRLIAKSIVKAGAKSIAISVAVLGPGFILVANRDTAALGILWLFVGSFGMMAWTYRKPWRLMVLTCLLPPVAVTVCFAVQLWWFSAFRAPPWLLLTAVLAGLAVGVFRGRAHEIYNDKGVVFAQRTTLYLGIWVVCYALTQLFAFIGTHIFLVYGGLGASAFSTAMLATVSIVLLRKRQLAAG